MPVRTCLIVALAACTAACAAKTSLTGPTTDATTADPAASSTSSTTSDSTAAFLPPHDLGGCPGGCPPCDTWTASCPRDHKCSPWSSDGDDLWDALRCVPLVPDPAHPGESCAVDGAPSLGLDTCDADAMCWVVDPQTAQGTCVPFCDGTPDAPSCPDGTACLIALDGLLDLCLPACDPLLQDCASGQLCISTLLGEPGFVCYPAGPGEPGQLHGPCDRLDACAPGLSCLNPVLAHECDQGAAGCCVPFCDLAEQGCTGVMQECQPWFGDHPPPGRERVGFCGVPL